MSIRWMGIRKGVVVALAALLVACASEAPPPGGPEDKTPPQVIATFPQPDTVNVSTETTVRIEFSEYLTGSTVKPSIFISPYISTEYDVNVKRRTVTINFAQPLADSTTYIITLGTGIADLRGNKLAQSYQLAFSTGPIIDQGVMQGRIYRRDMPEGDVTVLAYRHANVPLDSLMHRRPDYISNPGPQGYFRFAHMNTGDYFFLADQDQNKNYRYDPGEWTGIPPDTFWTVYDSVRTSALQMKMFQFPADSLILTKIDQQNRHQMTVGFNRAPAVPPEKSNFVFIGSGEDSLAPAALAAGVSQSEFLVEHYNTTVDSPYVFLARNLTGQFGLPFGRERDRRDIVISTVKDTLPFIPPDISVTDSATNVSQETPFTIRFSRAVQPLSPDSLLRITGIDTALYSLDWKDAQTLAASPDSLWPASAWLNWTLLDSLVHDYRDSTYSDSLSSGSFQFEDGSRYGSVSGHVDAPPQWKTGLIRVEASPNQGKEEYQTTVDTLRNYHLRRLPGGSYWIQAYYDADSSGTYDAGHPLPFVPSEKFIIFQDSIDVRARWERSGVNMKFPEK